MMTRGQPTWGYVGVMIPSMEVIRYPENRRFLDQCSHDFGREEHRPDIGQIDALNNIFTHQCSHDFGREEHSYGKSPFLMGKSTIYGHFQ